MATLANAKLSITRDKRKKLVTAVVKCTVRFTALELCAMNTCKVGPHFKLTAELWGDDPLVDDKLWVYSDVYYMPDSTPAASEDRTFQVTLGEGVLNEDWGQDEIYGKLILRNLATMAQVNKKTNVVSDHF